MPADERTPWQVARDALTQHEAAVAAWAIAHAAVQDQP